VLYACVVRDLADDLWLCISVSECKFLIRLDAILIVKNDFDCDFAHISATVFRHQLLLMS